MTKRLEINPDICYMLGIYLGNRSKEPSIGVSTVSDEILERFVRIALSDLGIEPSKIIVREIEERKIALFYNSKLKKLFENALERRERIFKYKNEYSANFFSGIFDCRGGRDRRGIYLRMSNLDNLILERLGFHTKSGRSVVYLREPKDFIAFIQPYSLKLRSVIRQSGNERDHR